MSRRTYLDYFHDIYEAAGLALSFVAGVDLDTFAENREKLFAVTRALEIVGEAARQVPLELQQRYPHLPWQEMIGMRNVLVHAYFTVDVDAVWGVVARDLPALAVGLERILGNPAAQ